MLAIGGSGIVAGLPRSLFAAPPAATDAKSADASLQGAGFFTFALGELTISLVSDGGFVMKPGEVFPQVPKNEIESALKAAHLSADAYPGQINSLLVRRRQDVILIDTGAGHAFGPTAGYLVSNLARAGVAPTDVTHVVLTHAHGDHIGGLLTAAGAPVFTRAKIYTNRAEHAFWTGANPTLPETLLPAEFQKMMVQSAQAAYAGVKSSLELVKPDDTIADVVKIVDAPGHTPGHVAILISANDGPKLLHVGDALFIPAIQLKHLDWHALYDGDPVMAAVTRQRLADRAAVDAMLVGAAHAPFPSVGYLDREEAGYRWTPKVWTWAD